MVLYRIKSVDSDTQLTLERIYQGPNDSGIGYWIANYYRGIEIRNLTIKNSGVTKDAGIITVYLKDSIISYNFIDGCSIGVQPNKSDQIIVEQNIVRNCSSHGIYLETNNHIFVTFNDLSNAEKKGIEFTDLWYSEISGNIIFNAMQYGINANGCHFTTISGNFIRYINLYDAILADHNEDSVFSGNQCLNAGEIGICLGNENFRNVFQGNIIQNNGSYGIRLGNETNRNNIILGNQFKNNPSGNISDLGLNTEIAHNMES